MVETQISSSRVAIRVLVAGLILGLPGGALLREAPFGLGVPIWMALMLAGGWWLSRSVGVKLSAGTYGFGLAALAMSAWIGVRDAPELRAMNLLMTLFCLGVIALKSAQGFEWRSSLFELGLRAPARIIEWCAEPLLILGKDIRWEAFRENQNGRGAVAITRGLVIAVPILLLFGALFASADQNFANLFTGFDLEVAFPYVFAGGCSAWVAISLYRQVLIANPNPAPPPVQAPAAEAAPHMPPVETAPTTPPKPYGITEVVIVLALTNVLFLVFGILQLKYFFGSSTVVMDPNGPSYAEYAKRGFFELVAVAGLTLPLVIGAKSVLARVGEDRNVIYRGLAALMIALVFATMASAAGRLNLYMDAYGLTQSRVYGAAFLVWLSLTFVWLAGTVMRGRDTYFAFGSAVAMLVVGFGLNVLNPDNLIARLNMSKAANVDYAYIGSLSADAAPAVASRWRSLPADARATISSLMLTRITARPNDFGSGNLGLWEARKLNDAGEFSP